MIKILQFGDGVFLRAFADVFFQTLKNAGHPLQVHVVAPLRPQSERKLAPLKYQVLARGLVDNMAQVDPCHVDCLVEQINPWRKGERVDELLCDPDLRVIVSNSTEAGLALGPGSFPERLLMGLVTRWQTLGDDAPMLFVLPCELIEDNGGLLLELLLQGATENGLPPSFSQWLHKHVSVRSTLVDRIVSGYLPQPAYSVACELFHFWAIEGDANDELARLLPFASCGLNVLFTPQLDAYTQRKIRLLNGAHTALVKPAMARGHQTVREAMQDAELAAMLEDFLLREAVPALAADNSALPMAELLDFARQTLARFRNPFLDHKLEAIAQNHEYKVDLRLRPTWVAYLKHFGREAKLLGVLAPDCAAIPAAKTELPS